MNTMFETGGTGNTAKTHDWLTPPEIVQALGPFDLDPCASLPRAAPKPLFIRLVLLKNYRRPVRSLLTIHAPTLVRVHFACQLRGFPGFHRRMMYPL